MTSDPPTPLSHQCQEKSAELWASRGVEIRISVSNREGDVENKVSIFQQISLKDSIRRKDTLGKKAYFENVQ